MIEIQNLTKKYGSIKAVDDINFTVETGEILGFLGPNGAGKSTTMNIITGYIPSSTGTVKVCGYDVFEEPKEVKKRIGYLPETPPLYHDMTVTEYLKFVADLKQVKKSEIMNDVNSVMKDVKIDNVSKRLIKNLSKGYKQRVGLAQALIGSPEVLILDEPTVGLDPKQIIEIRELIIELGKKHTVILSSHILSEVSAVCDRVVIINNGKIAAVDTPENLTKNAQDKAKLAVTVEGEKEKVLEIIKSIEDDLTVEIESENDSNIVNYNIYCDKNTDIRRKLFFELAKAEMPILELKYLSQTLEDIFLNVTTKNDSPINIEKENSSNDNELKDSEGKVEDEEKKEVPDEAVKEDEDKKEGK